MFRFKVLGFVFALIPTCLAAQESPASDATPFRDGQWAVQFGGGLSMVNLGVLRFTSPRSAWLLDLDVALVSLDGKRTDDAFGGPDQSRDEHLTVFATRLGRRFYQAHGSVMSYQTLAIQGFYGNQEFDTSDTTVIRFKDVSAGVSGELGAAYMLTPNLSLGGTASIFAGYVREEVTDAISTTTQSGFQLYGIQIGFVAAFYF